MNDFTPGAAALRGEDFSYVSRTDSASTSYTMQKLRRVTRITIARSALLLTSAYFAPLWQILMWAPQYPEGLEMKIWISDITGDVKIISALNHYIGMRHIDVSMFPEFKYMIYIVAFLIGVGLLAAIVNR